MSDNEPDSWLASKGQDSETVPTSGTTSGTDEPEDENPLCKGGPDTCGQRRHGDTGVSA